MSNNPSLISDRLLRLLSEAAARGSTLHRQFLQNRRAALQDTRALIEMQTQSLFPSAGEVSPAAASPGTGASAQRVTRAALFDARQLDEFGVGSIAACLGPAFEKYSTRRIPRIPNGDLKMMSRVVSITGCPGDFNGPASVVAEYDVPVDAWYLSESASSDLPVSLWMEIALQPCGFLSAYLDTYALVPYGEFYFRNLDGILDPLARLDVRGKTVVTRARLLSSVASGGTVIQKYAFELLCEGRPIYEGESTFGYFSAEAMNNQLGLDGGRAVLPALKADPALARRAARVDTARRRADPQSRLRFLDELFVVQDGGRHGKGYVYAAQPVDPRAWYYPYHFYQDPVMPGSLGVEAILEAMQGFALASGLGSRSARFAPGAEPMTWRYRGQILQRNKLMELEVHLSDIERQPRRVSLRGDASLWVDGLRIYEVKDASIGIMED